MFVSLTVIAVKWASAARELRQLKARKVVSVEVAIASVERAVARTKMQSYRRGHRQGWQAALAKAEQAVVETTPEVVAIRNLRNATK
jgi:septum formation inhibitor-activating ATPase MinD